MYSNLLIAFKLIIHIVLYNWMIKHLSHNILQCQTLDVFQGWKLAYSILETRIKYEAWKDQFLQPKPTPLAISVAKKGIETNPTNSTLIISLNLETRDSVTCGRVPLLRGIAHKTYVIVG